MEIRIIDQKIEHNPEHYNGIDEVERAGGLYYPPTKFHWTAQPIDLVELIDSIISMGCINNGEVVRKEVYEFIGCALNIDMSNHRGKLNKICGRSVVYNDPHSRIHFIPKLLEAFTLRLEELDKK